MSKNLFFLIGFVLLGLFSFTGFGAQVAKVKGKSVLIDTQGDPLQPGEIYYVIDLDGSRKAIVKIMKVRGAKAIARVGKGMAQVGMGLEKRKSSSPRQSVNRSTPSYRDNSLPSPMSDHQAYWGGLLGLGFDSLTADILNDSNVKVGTASTSGMSFSLMGLYDHRLLPNVWFRGLAGYEGFKTEGGSNCGTSSNQSCDVNLGYLSLDAIGRYLFSEDHIRPWVGGGLAILFPLSKSSSLLKSSSITNTYTLLFTGGVDWQISPTMRVPLSIEYSMFPKTDTVEASWIQIRGGVSVPF